ncbi:MAG: 6-bladed beta-propeller, partial [Phycisphaerae bacterium]|nr:6-bladed beta-propeller [Phycisphaerae bacterium]
PLRRIGSQGDLPGYFAQPKGVAIDPDGHVYVVDAQFEAVQVFSPEGRLLMTMGREGRGPGEFWLPAGIHIDAKGRVWIADSYNQRVQVFQYLGESANDGTSEGGKP